MEYTPPPFFKRGPSLLTRFAFFSMASVALLVADARFGYLESMRSVVAVVVYPLQQISLLPGRAWDWVSEIAVTHARLLRDQDQMRSQALRDASALQTQQALAAENEQLRKLLGMRQRIPREFRAADILYAPRDPFTRRVVIDKGTQDGVQAGLAVVDRTGVVGQITRVFPWAAEVTLITDKEHAVPIQVVRSGLRGVTFGVGYDGTLELRFMPVNADIQNGDLLVTSGIDGTYPPGLPVAAVTAIERNAAYAFARITCAPAAGVNSYGQVLIVSTDPRHPPNPAAAPEAPAKPARKAGP
jgi:rod shape-determining protein MreC